MVIKTSVPQGSILGIVHSSRHLHIRAKRPMMTTASFSVARGTVTEPYYCFKLRNRSPCDVVTRYVCLSQKLSF